MRDKYNYPISMPCTGECWAISAYPQRQSFVKIGSYKSLTLGHLWSEYPELFGHHKKKNFPLLTKIIDANDDLSIQVHPNDDYASKYENGELGKSECWYIIDCEKDAEIIIGHYAQTKQEFINQIKNRSWNRLLRRIRIKPGDFFYIPSGTLHAICKGTLVLETQQSSDITYRVFDYDRQDKNGGLRELHLAKAIDVTTIPYTESKVEPTVNQTKHSTVITFIKSNYFTVYKWEVHKLLEMEQNQPFMLISVIEGSGIFQTAEKKYEIHKGDHFILPFNMGSFIISGTIKLIVSHPTTEKNNLYLC